VYGQFVRDAFNFNRAGQMMDPYADRTQKIVLAVAMFFYLSMILLLSNVETCLPLLRLGGVCTLVGLTITDYVGESVTGWSLDLIDIAIL
jgi:hypothetical protein